MPLYYFTPQDVLFFRDSRPMEANVGSGGHGASWPSPSVFFDALHAAFWRAYPNEEPWEDRHRFGRSSKRDPNLNRTKRFGALRTAGPFPVLDKDWLFSCPGDVTHADDSSLQVLRPLLGDIGSSNLPSDWLFPLASVSQPSKEAPAAWWSKAAVESYLAAQPPPRGALHSRDRLFQAEWSTGIGRNADTRTQDGERIYSAEYLRLRPGVRIGLHADLTLRRDGSEGMGKLFNGAGCVVVGGQQRVCQVEAAHHLSLAAVLPLGLQDGQITGPRVKWVLLSPAVWPEIKNVSETGVPQCTAQGESIVRHSGGWLPNWICPSTGRVLLKQGDTTRADDRSRGDWRARVRALPAFSEATRLVAARVPKPQVITGWSDELHLDDPDESRRSAGPKPTHLAVPAGAVYYFECANTGEAVALASALNWHGNTPGAGIKNRRSTLFGEKGFGLGVCGHWEPVGIPSRGWASVTSESPQQQPSVSSRPL